MPSAKDGKACTITKPTDPEKALVADDDKAGSSATYDASSRTRKGGKSSSVKIEEQYSDGQDEEAPPAEPTDWISFELKDDKGNPVPYEPYEVTLPDGTIRTGNLDGSGKAKISGIPPGQCQISYPQMHKDEWQSG